MVYTLGDAAKATGKSKATISKAIKSGRISATKDETGTFQIDPAELHRVYPPTVSDEQRKHPRKHLTEKKIPVWSGSYKPALRRHMNASQTKRG
jgi:hypothetical protein